ncbi:MAG: BatD family protein, partial [Gammaproteobacteria bacterium]|nr:BatD family protein [Gammaproteobacteria bacterium]
MKQITFIFLLFSFSIQAMAATITAQADRNPVQANESFNLVFEAEGSVDDEPDFSPLLKDFTILNQSQGSSISIINGSYSKTTRWTLSLMANKEGVLTVPSIAFGNDRSPELRMTVKPEQTSAANQVNDLFLELETSTNDTWVQSQIVLTVRLFSANNISQFGISKLTTNNMDV